MIFALLFYLLHYFIHNLLNKYSAVIIGNVMYTSAYYISGAVHMFLQKHGQAPG